LTQREVEAVEARSGQSLRAPASRPRVIKASPQPSLVVQEIDDDSISHIQEIDEVDLSARIDPLLQSRQPSVRPVATSTSTINSGSYYTAPETVAAGQKRPYSEFADRSESNRRASARPSFGPSTPESFAYVTNLGQYRCALCLSQLPTQDDLTEHERVSPKHLSNLKDAAKVRTGQEKLAQVTAIPEAGRHHNTPVPMQITAPSGFQAINARPPSMDGRPFDSPMPTQSAEPDTIEVRRQAESVASVVQSLESSEQDLAAQQLRRENKGKGRAASLVACPPPTPVARTPFHPPPTPETRPTTARTEIGTLNTPQQPYALRAPENQQGNTNDNAPAQATLDLQAKLKSSTPSFSTTEMADILRSTELIVQLMGCIQREAKNVTTKTAPSTASDNGRGNADSSFESGYVSGSASKEEAASAAATSSTASSIGVPPPLIAPGIEVYGGIKRQRVGKARQQDTGEPVSFILLD
jgi:hypothetical protein